MENCILVKKENNQFYLTYKSLKVEATIGKKWPNFKDFICPDTFENERDYFRIGETDMGEYFS